MKTQYLPKALQCEGVGHLQLLLFGALLDADGHRARCMDSSTKETEDPVIAA